MSRSEITILSFQAPSVLRDELQRLAREHDRSMSAEVRAACRAYIQGSPPRPDERRGGITLPAAPAAAGGDR